MKIISAHQPAFFPWLGYFHKILLCDEFVIMDDVQFEKNSFINRNKILVNGNPLWLSIPVKTKDYKAKSIKEIEVTDFTWKKKHLKTIQQAYCRTSFYDEVMPLLEEIYKTESSFLIDYTNKSLFLFLDYLKINIPIKFASELTIETKKLDYVIEMTNKLKGDVFVFGAFGKDYADESKLKKEGIISYFQNYVHPQYMQKSQEFIPYLSVIDLIFNNGMESTEIIMNKNICAI